MEKNDLTSTEWLEKLKKRRTLCVIGIVAAYALNAVTFIVPSLQENTSAGMIILHIALFLLFIISIVSLVYTIKGIKAIKNTGVAPDYIKKPKVKTYIIVLVSVLTVFSVYGGVIIALSKNSSSAPDITFTNKYGTPTTKCAHPGCNNYIATSGDTNCCPQHSNRCLNCGKYCDGDAMYCGDCIKSYFD